MSDSNDKYSNKQQKLQQNFKQQSKNSNNLDQLSKQHAYQTLRRRIIQNQLKKIQKMSLNQVLQQQRKQTPQMPLTIHNPQKFLRHNLNHAMKQSGLLNDHSEQQIEELTKYHSDLLTKTQAMNKQKRIEMREAPLFSLIKRGKLGTDNIFVIFAMFGTIMLPLYFYNRFKQNKKIIIESRKLSPKALQNLDEDSPFNIDDFSQQSIHYANPGRQEQMKKKMKEYEKMTKLRKDLDL